jgi:hypothetical protein
MKKSGKPEVYIFSKNVLFVILLASFFIGFSLSSFSQTDEDQNNVCISIDPLGFLTFGPSVNAEFGLGKFIGLQAGFRVLNLGLFTDLILNDAGGFYPNMKFSWTVNFEAKFYIKPRNKLNGFYIGPKFDYGRSRYRDEWEWAGETQWQDEMYDVMVFGLGVGYKWIWDSGFSLEPSYNMAIFLSNLYHTEDYEGNTFDYTNFSLHLDLFALYVLSVKVGYAF